MANLALGEEKGLCSQSVSNYQLLSPVERRCRARYPIELQVRYHTLLGGLLVNGLGRTVNISSSGLLIASSDPVPAGTKLEVRIAWPSNLDGIVPLQLVATGQVVRSEEHSFAVQLSSHEFYTLKRDGIGTRWHGPLNTA